MRAVDAFQTDEKVRVMVCNLIAGGVGITLTAGTHVIFHDLDWVPANHAQAEDRAYRMGQKHRVTVEYMLGSGTLDTYVAELLAVKMKLIQAVEADEAPSPNLVADLEAKLRAMAPALLAESLAGKATGDAAARIEAIGVSVARISSDAPITETGVHEFRSAREPDKVYRVTWGRGGHLECTCGGFRWRGACKHVREVQAEVSRNA